MYRGPTSHKLCPPSRCVPFQVKATMTSGPFGFAVSWQGENHQMTKHVKSFQAGISWLREMEQSKKEISFLKKTSDLRDRIFCKENAVWTPRCLKI